jgi:hypothetical protein
VRVVRRAAVQGHAIPTTAHQPRGPFPSEVMAPNQVITEEEERIDPRANAQNLYRSPSMVRCTWCGDVMTEDVTDSHICEG